MLFQKGISYRDANGIYEERRPETSRGHLGAYYSHLLRDDFPSLQQSLVLNGGWVAGKASSGRIA